MENYIAYVSGQNHEPLTPTGKLKISNILHDEKIRFRRIKISIYSYMIFLEDSYAEDDLNTKQWKINSQYNLIIEFHP